MSDSPQNPTEYLVSHTETEDTGIRLFSVQDPNTKFLVTFAEFNPNFDVHVSVAWTGARTSRSDDPYEEIFKEIQELVAIDPVAAAKKIEKFGLNYGHSSILGMVPIFLFLNNLPIEMAFWLFNHMSIGDGQELSSRYVNFKDLKITDISQYVDFNQLSEIEGESIRRMWGELQQKAVANYEKWKVLVRDGYTKQFTNDEQQLTVPEGTMSARVLDIARMWIPIGATTSMCLLGNLRLWNDFIKKLQETEEKEYVGLAKQIKYLLKLKETEEGAEMQANLSGIVKYTEPQFTIRDNIKSLEHYLHELDTFENFYLSSKKDPEYVSETEVTRVESVSAGEIVVMQYILVLYPFMDELKVLTWLRSLEPSVKKNLGKIVLNGHNQHNLMGNMGDVRGQLYVIETAIAYLRDLNRHRADGRFIPLLETEDIESLIDDGFNLNFQLMQTDGLKHLLPEWEKDAREYYEELKKLYQELKAKFPDLDMHFFRKLLLLGHQTKAHFSAPISQWNYMISQRSTEGNDYSNRNTVFKILTDLRTDDFFGEMLVHIQAPNPNSYDEFKSRK